jgi:hypothetical protein
MFKNRRNLNMLRDLSRPWSLPFFIIIGLGPSQELDNGSRLVPGVSVVNAAYLAPDQIAPSSAMMSQVASIMVSAGCFA